MAKSREINMNLPSVDDLFTTQEERDQKNQEYVKDISIYEITDFPNHPFKVKMDDKMLETIESVRDHGVLVPALVREKSMGGYEMISGHRRKMASELAGKETMPCIVRNLSDSVSENVPIEKQLLLVWIWRQGRVVCLLCVMVCRPERLYSEWGHSEIFSLFGRCEVV